MATSSSRPPRNSHGPALVRRIGITESRSLLFGRDFGLVTDIQSGPDGHLYVLSNTHGAVYEIFRHR